MSVYLTRGCDIKCRQVLDDRTFGVNGYMKSGSGRRRLGTVTVLAAIGATLVAIWPVSGASSASSSAEQASIVLVSSSYDAAGSVPTPGCYR